MPIMVQEEWKCDICGDKSTVLQGTKPLGWAKFEVDDKVVDRMWKTHCVCDNCVESIIRNVKR